MSLPMPHTTMGGSFFNTAAQAPGSVSGTQWLLVARNAADCFREEEFGKGAVKEADKILFFMGLRSVFCLFRQGSSLIS